VAGIKQQDGMNYAPFRQSPSRRSDAVARQQEADDSLGNPLDAIHRTVSFCTRLILREHRIRERRPAQTIRLQQNVCDDFSRRRGMIGFTGTRLVVPVTAMMRGSDTGKGAVAHAQVDDGTVAGGGGAVRWADGRGAVAAECAADLR